MDRAVLQKQNHANDYSYTQGRRQKYISGGANNILGPLIPAPGNRMSGVGPRNRGASHEVPCCMVRGLRGGCGRVAPSAKGFGIGEWGIIPRKFFNYSMQNPAF